MAKVIKDLKALSILREHACYRHVGPTDLRDVFSSLSREHWIARTIARDRPSHYGARGGCCQ